MTIEFLNPLIDLAFQMLNAGTLQKNVIKHFTNKGLSFEASKNIVEVADFRFNEFNKNKSK